jgi:2-polyprenyl-6-methoxyphenol hydroxylase-like FAD-dependent oxidoreductase
VETPVLIVGAGPTGLLIAAELRRRGVAATLIDERDEPQQWDRATVVHPRTLELFASIGIEGAMLEHGVHQRGVRLFSAGELLVELDLGGSGARYGFNLNVSEEFTERVIAEHLAAQGGEVLRGRRLVGLEPGDEGGSLVATVEHEGGSERIRAERVVGCGGIHSNVRELSGIAYEGAAIQAPWAVFDVTLAGWPSEHDVNFAFFDERPLILTPLPGERWRAYLRPASPESDLVAEAAATVVAYHPEAELIEVENPRRFHCHQRIASAYRQDRVLLAGDAAHACSPGQGHGMNTGLGDAFNLAWKLALVCQGRAEEALLDSYEAERRPVAEAVVAGGDGFEEVMLLASAEERAARDREMRAHFADAAAARLDVVSEVELDISYAGSPIVAGEGAGDLAPGARLPADLQEHVRGEHTLLGLGVEVEPDAAAASFFDATVTLDPAAHGIEEPTVLAIRPDLHIGAVGPEAVTRYPALIRTGG